MIALTHILVGTHGRGAVSRFLMGSVAERVMRTAPCPVLTVHADERDFIEPRDDHTASWLQSTTNHH